jgi:sugar lactone lactonase YvrE
MAQLRVVLDGLSFLEAPRWRAGRLWLSDFYTHQVLSLLPDGADLRTEAEVPGQPSGLGWLPDGRLLVVSMRDRRVLRREARGELVEHADLSAVAGGHVNDLLADAAGRAYVGNFGFDLMAGDAVRPADLLRIDPDGGVTPVAGELHFANGMAVVDGELVVAETFGNRLSAFPIAADGGLGERNDWVRFGDLPTSTEIGDVLAAIVVAPDGICADAEGAIWVADALGQRAVRVRRGVGIVAEIAAGTGVYACALGGDDGRTLYLCAAPGFAEHERRDTREAQLLAVPVDVPAA